MLTDVIGRPTVIHLTPGNRSDVRAAKSVLAKAPGPIRRLIADRGYDADWLRRHLRDQNTVPIIPGRKNRKRTVRHDKKRHRNRWWIDESDAFMLWQAQGLPARGHPLRQAGPQLRFCRGACFSRRLLALIGFGA